MINVYMMDLWCQVPYYDAYLCQALQSESVRCVLGSISFHLEPDYFRRMGLKNDPGCCDIVARLNIESPKIRRALKFVEFVGNMTVLASRFAASRPDIIHVQWLPMLEFGVPGEMGFLKLAKKRGIKLVYTVHNVLPHDSELNVRGEFGKAYTQMDALICHTTESRDRLVEEFRIEKEKIRIIPHGPLFHEYQRMDRQEAKSALGLESEECVVLYQGAMRPYKGVEFLLEAWKGVHANNAKAKLVVAGTGDKSYLEVIRAKVETLGIKSSVKLNLHHISTEDVPIYYQACDIAVYPHKEITQSGALMTGIAFGRPVVATDLPAFREALENYPAAFVEHGDVSELSRLLTMLIANPGCLARTEDRSLLSNDETSWKVIGQQTLACYEEVVGCARKAQARGIQSRAQI